MRLGLFGGSFDPPHLGHLAVAVAALERFGLEEVLWAPTGRQPLKATGPAAPFADRLAMVALGCAESRRLRASAVDGPRLDGEPNYTVETLRLLQRERPSANLFVIVGMDAFRQMQHWREPERLMEMAEWIVVTRPGYEADVAAGGRVHLLDDVHVDVSATMLRERLRAGADCAEWIAAPVLAYIAEHGLYVG